MPSAAVWARPVFGRPNYHDESSYLSERQLLRVPITGIYHTAWYEDGGKQEEIYLKEGERHGSYTYWYENGQKQEEGIFKEGKADGICIMYNEKGYDKLETFWKDDEEVIDSP